jgi:hypothetical protein
MTNSELAKQAYAINEQIYDIAREAFDKCREAGIIDKHYSFDKYELDQNGMEITGEYYACGDTDYESFHIPYADLDNIDAFVIRRQAEIAEEKRKAAEKKAAEQAQKAAAAEQAERQQYERLKEKYEGVAK